MQETEEKQIRAPEKGHGNPLRYSCLENPMDRGAWRVMVQRCKESDTAEATEHIHRGKALLNKFSRPENTVQETNDQYYYHLFYSI